jgi:hypothetical protein
MLRALVAIVLLSLLLAPWAARAHDSWISKGGHRNAAGEWCCGAGDCAMLDPKAVTLTRSGYQLDGFGTIEGDGKREHYRELVPHAEAMPSPDGAFWRCHRPDGSRRCFFAPPPNT